MIKYIGIFFLVLTIPKIVLAQCGITPVVELSIIQATQTEYTAENSVLGPNCVVYQHEWKLNGTIISTTEKCSLTGEWGFNEVSYAAWIVDTITNDSCYNEYKNIYNSTGNEVYAGSFISVFGLDANVQPQWWYNQSLSVNILVDWGDGSPPFSFFHTYAMPGTYTVCVSASTGSNAGFSCMNAQINNGQTTFVDNSWSVPNSNGQIQTHNFSSAPAFSDGTYQYQMPFGKTGNFNSGTPLSVTDTLTVPGQHIMTYSLADVNGPFTTYPSFFHPFTVDPINLVPDTIRGFCWHDDDSDGIVDSTENPAVGESLSIYGYSTTTDSSGNYEILMPKSKVVLDLQTAGTSIPATPSYTLSPNASGLHENINFGIIETTVTLNGRVYLDANSDSVYNAGETPVESALVTVINVGNGNTQSKLTATNGTFSFLLPLGDYKMIASTDLLDSSYTYPDSISIPGASGIYNGQNFALYSTASGVNHNVSLVSQAAPRPGFTYTMRAALRNQTLDTASSILTISYDSLLIPQSVDPPSGTINTIDKTVTWQVPALNFGDLMIYTLNCSIPSTAALGTSIQNSVNNFVDSMGTDYDLSNNIETLTAVLIGSFDPNDKSVVPDRIDLSPGASNPDDLFYHINFQNTGTASAINIVIEDEIDPNLDLSTLQMIGASHNYVMIINDRTISWQFLNINLPDSNTNEALSHGWIEYTIEPLPGLPAGTVISNEASIFFDFNEPIVTNTTTTDYILCNLGVSYSKRNVSCNNFPNGSTTAFTTGTHPPFSYLWSNGDTSNKIDLLPGGSYQCTVTDAQACEKVVTVDIFEPDAVTAFTIANNPNPGDINLLVSGGVAPYRYNWSTGASTEDVSGLSPGFYFVQVTDFNGCSKIVTVQLP